MSSAKRWEILTSLILAGYQWWESTSLLLILERTFIQRIKIKGDKGSPRLIPNWGLKDCVRPPLKIIGWLTKEIELINKSIQSLGKLKASKVDIINSQFNLSLTFSRFILIIIQPNLPFSSFWKRGNNLLSYDSIIYNFPIKHKSSLIKGNDFDSVHHNFRNNFIQRWAMAYGSEIFHLLWLFTFRDETNETIIPRWGDRLILKIELNIS